MSGMRNLPTAPGRRLDLLGFLGWALLGLLLALPAAAQAAQDSEPGSGPLREGHLRIAQLLPASGGVEVVVNPKAGEGKDRGGGPSTTFGPLEFRRVSGYRSFAPGIYDVKVRRGGETLMEMTYGLGERRHYTLVLYGVPSGEAPQPATLWKRLNTFFAGFEAGVANGWVAQHRMLLDRPGRTRGASRLRVMHAAPGLAAVALKLHKGGTTVGYGEVRYPEVGPHLEVEPGTWRVVVRPPGSPLKLLEVEIRAEPDGLATLFLTGTPFRPGADRPPDPPELVLAPSPSSPR